MCSQLRMIVEAFLSMADADGHYEFAISDPRNCGITLHYVATGFTSGAANAILFNVLAGYLNVPSDTIKAGANLAELPSVFIVLLGILSDSRPICGLRRRPYMAGGWLLAAACCFFLIGMGLPAPYYCFSSADERYQYEQPPCNPDAVEFYVLMVEYAKAEPVERRGRAQTLVQMVHMAGYFVSLTIVAFGFNGRMFTGSFSQLNQLSYEQAVAILAVMCLVTGAAGFPASSTFKSDRGEDPRFAFCAMGLFFFANTSIFNLSTTARTWVALEWAKTENMQRQISGMLAAVLSFVGCWLTQKWFLGVSWRKIICATGVLTSLFDSIPQFCTIFDVIRNQYFYLGEPLTENVPQAMAALVSTFMINELADDSNCALVAGLMNTIPAVGQQLSVLLSNQEDPWMLSLNYVEDTPEFRRTVASSFLLLRG
ncbi:hypothetical protein AK812_SmicGene16621 [Symbiodinium microadriaticum]|uniref:Uncharacterized protein n=1 Tax=Symbiodinium microadriaticum TaxID=2951 RepID=A0A1Q9DZV9_SYMMI|nr:hypothetical protein AK812_SmicGene16621 [Symbiodinium microadriaticum]